MALRDAWAAYQFDSAVTTFGVIIENALQERVNRGGEDKPQWDARYTLSQLLMPGFIVHSEDDQVADDVDWSNVEGLIYDEVGG